MAQANSATAVNPLHLAGSVLVLGGSVMLMFHRMPHHEYAAMHADAPRPRKPPSDDFAPVASPEPAPAAAASERSPSRPAFRAPETPRNYASLAYVPQRAPRMIAAAPAATADSDWTEDCAPEMAIFCHAVPDDRVKNCLLGHAVVLLQPCRLALDPRPAIENAPETGGRDGSAPANPNVCAPEIGILCHGVPRDRLKSCLREYDDALLKPCRRALASESAEGVFSVGNPSGRP
jgi:hypothetical protein